LRARARAKRWNEEKDIVVKEMEWVVGTFQHMREVWEIRAENAGDQKPGHKSYALKEAERWKQWGKTGKAEFAEVSETSVSDVKY
jgi:hypothetical protein